MGEKKQVGRSDCALIYVEISTIFALAIRL